MKSSQRNVLLLLDGICKESYVLRDIYKEKTLLEKLLNTYRHIEAIETNKILDWGLIGGEVVLKYGDVLRFLYSPIRRLKITNLIERTVKKYKALGYEVTILAHSLGTIKLLDSNLDVDYVILTGCPLEFVSRTAATIVRTTISPFPWSKPKVKCKKVAYLWATGDKVSCREIADLDRFVTFKEGVILNTQGIHDFPSYLDFISKKEIIPSFIP